MNTPRTAHPYGRSADDVRRRDQRTRRTRRVRITQLILFSLLAISLIGVGAYALGELREPPAEPGVIAAKTFGKAPSELVCPQPEDVPLAPEDVTVNVKNGTTRSGLAGQTAAELAERGYVIEETGNTRQSTGAATIVHGSKGYLAAQSLAAQINGAQLRMDDRDGTAVDLLLGEGYTGLEDADAAAATLTQPVEIPEGC